MNTFNSSIDAATAATATATAATSDTSRQSIMLCELTSFLQEKTPNTQYQLPEGFYRCDLLYPIVESLTKEAEEAEDPEHPGETGTSLAVLADTQEDFKVQARHAYVELDYSEGYPALAKEGTPFWHKLPHESQALYDLFQHYVLLGDTGARVIQQHYDLLPTELRELHSIEDLQQFRILYYWVSRAKAFDAFDTMTRRRQRACYASQAEDRHYFISEMLLKKSMAFIQSEAFLEGLNPKTALEAVKLGISMQRQALGLSPNAAGDGTPPQFDMQFELHRTMNPMAKDGEWHGNQGDASEMVLLPDGSRIPRGHASSNTQIREVLRDPESLRLAETLIIKMSQKGKTDEEPS